MKKLISTIPISHMSLRASMMTPTMSTRKPLITANGKGLMNSLDVSLMKFSYLILLMSMISGRAA